MSYLAVAGRVPPAVELEFRRSEIARHRLDPDRHELDLYELADLLRGVRGMWVVASVTTSLLVRDPTTHRAHTGSRPPAELRIEQRPPGRLRLTGTPAASPPGVRITRWDLFGQLLQQRDEAMDGLVETITDAYSAWAAVDALAADGTVQGGHHALRHYLESAPPEEGDPEGPGPLARQAMAAFFLAGDLLADVDLTVEAVGARRRAVPPRPWVATAR